MINKFINFFKKEEKPIDLDKLNTSIYGVIDVYYYMKECNNKEDFFLHSRQEKLDKAFFDIITDLENKLYRKNLTIEVLPDDIQRFIKKIKNVNRI